MPDSIHAVLTVREVANSLGVSRATVRRFIASGELQAFDVGRAGADQRQPRVTREALKSFVASRVITGKVRCDG